MFILISVPWSQAFQHFSAAVQQDRGCVSMSLVFFICCHIICNTSPLPVIPSILVEMCTVLALSSTLQCHTSPDRQVYDATLARSSEKREITHWSQACVKHLSTMVNHKERLRVILSTVKYWRRFAIEREIWKKTTETKSIVLWLFVLCMWAKTPYHRTGGFWSVAGAGSFPFH